MKKSLFNIKPETVSTQMPGTAVNIEKVSKQDIAIVGMAGKLPMADNLDQFWQNLTEGKDCVTSYPEQRVADMMQYLRFKHNDIEEVAFKEKGYLKEIDKFDYKFFKISPKEASLMSPAQRLFLQTVWLTLEEAGYAGKSIRGSRTGVYVGYTERRNFYYNMIFDVERASATLAYTGNIASIIASRISYLLDLKGPSLLVDTACSSSLVAVHLACQAIRSGDCESAIAGGINIHWLPTKTQQGEGIGVESTMGRARTFDDSSDGTIGGEGCVALLLKPLSKALRDGDHVHAVIKGSATNQDGSSIGITAPSVLAQEEVITKAWRNANIHPETLSYIEAHGTATELGDPIEIDGISRAFRAFTAKKQFCAIGSVKTNMGHLDATAGLAGLVKATLSLKNKQLPPHLHFEKPNGKINFEESPVFVNDSLTPWHTDPATPRRCGVSSFGISGTNCHVVLEEAPVVQPSLSSPGLYLLPISAKSETAFQRLLTAYQAFLQDHPTVSLRDLCYTASVGRDHHPYRIALFAEDSRHLQEQLTRLLASDQQAFFTYKIVAERRANRQPNEYTQAEIDGRSRAINTELGEATNYDEALLHAVRNAYCTGADVAWEKIYHNQPGQRISLPLYPFDEKRCWIDYPAELTEPVGTSETTPSTPAPIQSDLQTAKAPQTVRQDEALAQVVSKQLALMSLQLEQLKNRQKANTLQPGPVVATSTHQPPIVSPVMDEPKAAKASANEPLPESLTIPLTDEQQRLWLLSQVDETASAAFNLLEIVPVFDVLNTSALHKAVEKLVARHEILRVMSISETGQHVVSHVPVTIPVHTLLEGTEQEAALEAWIANERRQPFSTRSGPFFRANVLQLGNDRFFFVLVVHHLIVDGWSLQVLKKELTELYIAECEQKPLQLPAATPFSAYVAWLNQTAEKAGPTTLRFWQQQFDKSLPNEPTLTRSDSGASLDEGGSYLLHLNAERTQRLKTFSQRQGVSLFATLLATNQVLLARLTGHKRTVSGLPIAGQLSMEKEHLVGQCVQMLPFQLDIADDVSFVELVKIVQQHWFQVRQNACFSLSTLLEAGVNWPDLHWIFNLDAPKQDPGQSPLVESYQITERPSEHHKYALFVNAIEVNKELHLRFQYHRGWLTTEAMHYWVEQVASMLERITGQEVITIDELLPTVGDQAFLPRFVAKGETDRLTSEYEPPRSGIETTLAEMFAELLNKQPIGRHDHFFRLGGNSLRAMQLLSRIYQTFSIRLTVPTLFGNASVAQLAPLVQQADAAQFASIPVLATQDYYDVSHAQKRLWILHQIEEDLVAYNMSSAYSFNGTLNRLAFEKAICTVIERHESLRTSFVAVDGEPKQRILAVEDVSFQLAYEDIRNSTDQEGLVRGFIEQEKAKPFDLNVAPLIRATLIHLDTDTYQFLLTMHHIISDGWSKEILVEEVLALYEAYRKGDANPLAPLPVQYKDFVAWQNGQLNQDGMLADQQFWLDQYGDELPILNLLTDYPRPPVRSQRGAVVSTVIPKESRDALLDIGQQQGATLFMTLLAATNTLLYRYTRQEDIIIGSPFAGRDHPDLDNLIGFFVTTLSFRTRFRGHDSFEKLLETVKEHVLQVYEHQLYPVDRLIDDIDLQRDLSRSPLFDVMVNLINIDYQGTVDTSSAMADVTIADLPTQSISNKFDLSFTFRDFNQGVLLTLNYNTDLFASESMERMLGHFQQLLVAIATNQTASLQELNLLTPAEKEYLAVQHDRPIVHQDQHTIIDAFERQVRTTPEATAVIFGERQLTYRQLNEQVNQLAHYFRDVYQIQPEDRIGLLLQRSEHQIVSLLAVLKAGAAYVPLDPSLPKERIAFMHQDSGMSILYTDEAAVADWLPENATVVLADAISRQVADLSTDNPIVLIEPHQLAYVMYTSGSTGEPKGVAIEHAALLDYTLTFTHYFELTTRDVVIQQSSLSFDTAVEEIYPTLCAGACLSIVKEGSKDIDALLAVIEQTGATILSVTPLVVNELNKQAERLRKLRVLISGGSQLKSVHISRLIDQVPIYNTYGPTESTVCVTYHHVQSLNDASVIGKPIPNRGVYILDDLLQQVPIGLPGQLCIDGAGLARGYLNRPELNQQKFIAHPFVPGERLYLTGDVGRWLSDGSIQFLGRNDDQVQIRGNRIEIDEIDSTLTRFPAIEQAAVIAKEEADGDIFLVAFYTSQNEFDVRELREYMASKLPAYGIPAFFVRLAEFPVLVNSKIDYKTLRTLAIDSQASHNPARNSTETALVRIWQDVLNREGVGISDNFFEIGGHSLKATRVVALVHQQLGYKLSLRDLFRSPTIEGISQLMHTTGKKAYEAIVPIPRQDYYEVSHSQKQLWILDQLEKELIAYNMPMAYEFEGELNTDALERAFQTLIERHESLRTTFTVVDGELKQRIQDITEATFIVDFIDLRLDPDGLSVARELLRAEASAPFNLETGPLLRAKLLRLENDRYLFVYTLHHIISDGWSMLVLVEDILALYNAYAKGLPNPLSPLKIQYKDFVAWQQRLFSDKAQHEDRLYWLNRFSGDIPVLNFPTDNPRPAYKTQTGASNTLFIEPELAQALKGLAQQHTTTLFTTLLASVKALLFVYTGQRDLIIGSPVAGREHGDLDNQIGFFVNTLALRTAFDPAQGFDQLLNNVKETVIGAFDHQAYSFDQLVDELAVQRDLSRSPLFDVMVVLLNAEVKDGEASDLEGLQTRQYSSGIRVSKYDFTFNFREVGGGILLSLNYNTDLFEEDSVLMLLEKLKRLLTQVIADERQPLQAYQLEPVLNSVDSTDSDILEFNFL